jgi:hypothetical protein
MCKCPIQCKMVKQWFNNIIRKISNI